MKDVHIAHLSVRMPTKIRTQKVLKKEDMVLNLRLIDIEYYLGLGGVILKNEVIWIKSHHVK